MNQQLQYTTPTQRREALLDELFKAKLADGNPDGAWLNTIADNIEVLFGERCPKCNSAEIGQYSGSSRRRCFECGVEVGH